MRTNSSSVATKYQHSQVSHADPVQLIVLLYDGALSRIAQGRQRLQEKDEQIAEQQRQIDEQRSGLESLKRQNDDLSSRLARLEAAISR